MLWLWRGRQLGRFACGFAPAFGRAVRALRGLVYGTAEAVPLRGLVRNYGREIVSGETVGAFRRFWPKVLRTRSETMK